MPKPTLTHEILAAALQGLEAQRARLESQIAEVRRLVGARARPGKPAAPAEAPTPKRKLSAAARKRIADAATKRWEEYRRKKAQAARAAKAPAKKTASKSKKKAVVKAASPPVAAE